VLKGLAADGGLFLPEEVPIPTDWVCTCTPTLLAKRFAPDTPCIFDISFGPKADGSN